MQNNILSLVKNPKGGTFYNAYRSLSAGRHLSFFGCSVGEKALLALGLERSILYVAGDSASAAAFSDAVSSYGVKVLRVYEMQDTLLYKQNISLGALACNLSALYSLAYEGSRVTVVTSECLLSLYPPKSIFNGVVKVNTESVYPPDRLIRELTELGYSREERAENKGEFSFTGENMTVYPPESDVPVRINFYDTMVESMHKFDSDTMMVTKKIDSFTFLPCTDVYITAAQAKEIMDKMTRESKILPLAARQRINEIIEDISFKCAEGSRDRTLNYLSSFMQDRIPLTEYLKSDCVIIHDSARLSGDKLKVLSLKLIERVEAYRKEGECTSYHKNAQLSYESAVGAMLTFPNVDASNITGLNNLFSPDALLQSAGSAVPQYTRDFSVLLTDLRRYRANNYTVILCYGDESAAKNSREALRAGELPTKYTEVFDIAADMKNGIYVTPFAILRGFTVPSIKLCVIGTGELLMPKALLGAKKDSKSRRVFLTPEFGDYVVHRQHGIGLCKGIKHVETNGSGSDYVTIEYKNSTLFYMPVDQMDKLDRYSGSDVAPRLSELGGKDFGKLKERVKNSIKTMAIDLAKLYGVRKNTVGHKYMQDTSLLREMEDSFAYAETADQLTVIADIKRDMETGVLMDRLLCGDVGFGKTEVALRAILKTVTEKKQAAILAPTTILAVQHFNTATARLAPFGVIIEILTRFQTNDEIKESIARLKSGKSDLAIATHRLLSADVGFKDLGLLVLDEEQRFGVEHKEKIKSLKNSVNVLSMTATPIPRTLDMALSGIRDISVLETPPVSRIPIQTFVAELTDSLLIDAVTRELARGGQVYILHNRVSTIADFACHVRELFPSARIAVGHGQMASAALENVISDFYAGRSDVLICTTIIENGIDLPNANTIIVCDSDRLGISALYQLRGRVGRSNIASYAYFTTRESKVISENAVKRLNAVMEYTELGSGFKIAMRDLEIRGAGNVLGREQHGHIVKVGYDLYCKLLREVVGEVNGIAQVSESDVELRVDLNAYISDEYIADKNIKLRLYKEIADIATASEADGFIARLNNLYGNPPLSAVTLIRIGYMKNLASAIGAETVVINKKECLIRFSDNSVLSNQSAVNAVSQFADTCSLRSEKGVVVLFDLPSAKPLKRFYHTLKFLETANGVRS